MPKGKKPPSSQSKGNAAVDDSPAASQAYSQAVKAAASMERGEQERKVNELVQYLVIMDQKKLPIKKLDINKHVLKEHSKAFQVIVEKASERLRKVFGVELVELQDKHKGSFILINSLNNDSENPHLEWPPDDDEKMGLIMILLSLIFMNGNVMQDTQIWHALKKLGIDPDREHEVFGDVKKTMQEFVRQGYLDMVKSNQTDPPTVEYRWGQRAKAETTKRNILNFVCQIYGDDMEPQQWTSQWQDILRSEGVAEPGTSTQG